MLCSKRLIYVKRDHYTALRAVHHPSRTKTTIMISQEPLPQLDRTSPLSSEGRVTITDAQYSSHRSPQYPSSAPPPTPPPPVVHQFTRCPPPSRAPVEAAPTTRSQGANSIDSKLLSKTLLLWLCPYMHCPCAPHPLSGLNSQCLKIAISWNVVPQLPSDQELA